MFWSIHPGPTIFAQHSRNGVTDDCTRLVWYELWFSFMMMPYKDTSCQTGLCWGKHLCTRGGSDHHLILFVLFDQVLDYRASLVRTCQTVSPVIGWCRWAGTRDKKWYKRQKVLRPSFPDQPNDLSSGGVGMLPLSNPKYPAGMNLSKDWNPHVQRNDVWVLAPQP